VPSLVRDEGTYGGEEVMSTEVANGAANGAYLLAIVGRLVAINRETLRIFERCGRNRDGSEGRLHTSASVYYRLGIPYLCTSM
jgi:hypothetical protein